MAQRRDWFKHDAWFLADDKIRRLGHKFGAEGPLVAEALLELAKRQRMAGDVEVEWSYLAEHAFVKGSRSAQRRTVSAIIQAAAESGFVEVAQYGDDEVRLTLPKWCQIQGGGVPGSERTANWRARKAAGSDGDVTSLPSHSDGDVTRLSRAVAKETAEKADEAKASSAASGADKEMVKASEEDRENLRLFIRLGRERNPKLKTPAAGTKNLGEWFKAIRLLRESDDNTAEEIERVIRWLFTDPSEQAVFWGGTIAAPSGLRAHFPQLWAKMTSAPAVQSGVRSSADVAATFGRRAS